MASYIEIPAFDLITTQKDDLLLCVDVALIGAFDEKDNHQLPCNINKGILMIELTDDVMLGFPGLTSDQLNKLSDAKDFVLAAFGNQEAVPRNLWVCSSHIQQEMRML